MILISILCPVYAYAEDLYIGQSSAGAGDGTSCANQRAISFFNTAGNWGVGANKISAGDTVYLCGTITTAMAVQGAGSAGNIITISPAPAQTTTIDATGMTSAVFNFSGYNYVTLDGVSGDKVAGDTDYRLVFTNLASTAGTNTFAVYENNSGNHIAIKHVKAIFTGSTSPDDNGGGIYVRSIDGVDFEIAYCWVTGTSAPNKHAMGITTFAGAGNGTSYTSFAIIHHNYVEYMYHDGMRGGANNSFYNNYIKEIGGSGHSDGIICQSGNYCAIYNNTFDNGAEIYLDNILDNTRTGIRVYNNVGWNSGAGASFGVEIISEGGGSSVWDDVVIANNTFCNSASGIRGSGGAVTNLVIMNNIFCAPTQSYENITGSNGITFSYASNTSFDYNAYGLGGPNSPDIHNVSTVISTLAELQALSPARETNGRTGTVTFVNSGTGDFHLSGSDTVAQGNGVDLTSTYSYLTTDKDGVARPNGSAWDVGAYEYVPVTTNGLALFLQSVEVLIPLSGLLWHFRRGLVSAAAYLSLSTQLLMALIVVPQLEIAGRRSAFVAITTASRAMTLLARRGGR